MNYIGQIPYFQTHPDLLVLIRFLRIVWDVVLIGTLVRRDSADTVILFHHHDTVDTEDFGSLERIGF